MWLLGYNFKNLRRPLVSTAASPVQPATGEKRKLKKKKNCNADRTDWTVWKFKMSTVKFLSVQFGCDGVGLQFSRQWLMGYIHHYWVIARSSRVLRQRKRGIERGQLGWEGGEGWRARVREREMEKEENKEVRTKNHYRGFALVELFRNVWKCDIRRGVLYH